MESKNSPYYLGNQDVLPTVLSLKHASSIVTVELPWDVNIDELLSAFVGACVGVTFSERSVLRAMKEYAQDRLPEEEL
jgi:hypothetical protein